MPTALSDRRTAKVRPADSRYVSLRRSIRALSKPVYSPHRCGGNVYPENDKRGVSACASQGRQYIQFDVQLTSDGQGVCFHDTTVDRTTTSTGLISSFTLAQVKAMVSDTSVWQSKAWPDSPPTALVDVLSDASITQGHTLFLEAMQTNCGQAIAAAVSKFGLIDQVAVSSRSLDELTPCHRIGIETWYISDDGSIGTATLLANGIDGVCMQAGTVSATLVNTYRAAGIKVELHTLNRQSQKTAYAGCDVNVWATNEPLYVEGDVTKYRLTRDPFFLGDFSHGMLPSTSNSTTLGTEGQATENTGSTLRNRGSFPALGWWGATSGCLLMGTMCPADPTKPLTFHLCYDTFGTDATRYGLVFFGASTDDSYKQDVLIAANTGDQVLLRRNGSLEYNRITAGSAGSSTTRSTSAMQALTLGAALTAGANTPTLTVTALTAAVTAGQMWRLPDGQIVKLQTGAASGATSLSVANEYGGTLVPTVAVANGSTLPPIAKVVITPTFDGSGNPTGLTVQRTDVTSTALTITDTITRGGYFHLGFGVGSGLVASFGRLAIG